MSAADYREALRLLNSALEAVGQRNAGRSQRLRRRLRSVALEVDLLQARLRQPPVSLQRN